MSKPHADTIRTAIGPADHRLPRRAEGLAALDALLAENQRLRKALDVADWLITCERDFGKGKVVRGLGEARAGYESALRRCGAKQ